MLIYALHNVSQCYQYPSVYYDYHTSSPVLLSLHSSLLHHYKLPLSPPFPTPLAALVSTRLLPTLPPSLLSTAPSSPFFPSRSIFLTTNIDRYTTLYLTVVCLSYSMYTYVSNLLSHTPTYLSVSEWTESPCAHRTDTTGWTRCTGCCTRTYCCTYCI